MQTPRTFNPGRFQDVLTNRSATPEAHRTAPYFHRNPPLILQNDASAILAHRDTLLAYGIPATTRAVGTVEVVKKGKRDMNLQKLYIDDMDYLWARGKWSIDAQLKGRWLHSDIKDVAYPFTRKFYLDILQKGQLK